MYTCPKNKNPIVCNMQVNVKVLAVMCDENKVRKAGPGENVRVKLSGVEEDDISAGFVLSCTGNFHSLHAIFFFLNTYVIFTL